MSILENIKNSTKNLDATKVVDNFKKASQSIKKSDSVENLFSIGNNSQSKEKLSSDLSLSSYGKNKKENSIIMTIVNDIFLNAIMYKASDIHIEPREKSVKVRYRVDGQFIGYKDFNINYKDPITARIKIMSMLRIDEHRLPQDGKINYKLFGGKSVDMRVSIIPTIYGEKCVIRLLKKDSTPPKFKEVGLLPYNTVKIEKHLKDNYGMILVVGPTGSGKSTTLFSMLSNFNPEKYNISTLEDPVEYRIPGVNHTQINTAIDFSFAKGLRSLLRQDPDIIMVGEIRDEETAKLAIEASITGHIVFSTLHTNSAAHTIQRLVNLGVDPLLIASSLRMIVSQRLVRKLCEECKVGYIPSEKVKNFFYGKIGRYIKNKDNFKLFKVNDGGCKKCNQTGYNGRVGIFEILEMSEKIEKLLLENASRTKLEIASIGDGMVTIKEDGLLKVLLGETSLEEILSVLGT